MFVEDVFMLISQIQDVGTLAITSYYDMFTLAYLLHVDSDISKHWFEGLYFCLTLIVAVSCLRFTLIMKLYCVW